MKYREIKQHHLPAVISITALFLIDSIAYYSTYIITDIYTVNHVGMPFPWRVYFVVIFIIYLFKNYNPSPRISRWKEAKTIIQSIYITGILYTFWKILTKDISIDQSQYDLLFIHLFLIIDIPLRFIVRSIQRLFLAMGIGGRSTILLGSGKDAQHVANDIICHPILGFDLQGYFSQSEADTMNRYCSYLGDPDDVYSYVQTHAINEMIIILETHEHDNLLAIIGRYEMLDICIKIIPDMYESITGQVRIDVLNGIPLLDINPDIITEFQSIMKRIIDIVLSIIILTFMLPLLLALMIIIPLNSTGGVFYDQLRVGTKGTIFKLYKFRTMYINSERDTGPIWAEHADSRITQVGRVLRKYHLDEIPQLYNVLKGQMSIVGPRPERPQIIDTLKEKIPYYTHRLKVKPGITGWAQIRGAYDAGLEDVYLKLRHDFYYVENTSIFLDIKILFITALIILKGKGQ